MRTLILLAAAAVGWWWWRRREALKPPAPGTTTSGVVATLETAARTVTCTLGGGCPKPRTLDPVGLGTTVPSNLVNPGGSKPPPSSPPPAPASAWGGRSIAAVTVSRLPEVKATGGYYW